MSIVAPLVIAGTTAAAGITELRRHIPEWNGRGFKPLEPHWGKVSLTATIFSLLFGILTFLQTQNPVTTLIVSVIALFSIVVAYSDNTVRKVPSEISNYMVAIGAIIMSSLVLTPNKTAVNEALQASLFFPRIPTDSLLSTILFGLLLLAVGFLGFLKIPALSIAHIFLSLGQIGIFIAIYTPLLWAAYSAGLPEYWRGTAETLILPITALGVIWFFSWAVGNKIGGADILYMYFISMTASFILGPGGLLWAIVLAMPIQLVVHLVGTKLGWGEMKEIRNGPISQFFENRKAKKEQREPRRTKQRRAIAFLPAITVTVLIVLVGSLSYL